MDTLPDDHGGVWLVRTQSSTYTLDLDGRVLTRTPGEDPLDGFTVAVLRQDHNPVPLRELVTCQVGHEMVVVLDVRGDGVDTVRVTTPVVTITPIEPAGGSVTAPTNPSDVEP